VGLEVSGRSRSHTPCGVGVGVLDIRATSYDPTKPLLHVRVQSGRRNLAQARSGSNFDISKQLNLERLKFRLLLQH
jgi:hypothetical protein